MIIVQKKRLRAQQIMIQTGWLQGRDIVQKSRRSCDTKKMSSSEEVRPNEIQKMCSKGDDGMDQIIMGKRVGKACDIRTDMLLQSPLGTS